MGVVAMLDFFLAHPIIMESLLQLSTVKRFHWLPKEIACRGLVNPLYCVSVRDYLRHPFGYLSLPRGLSISERSFYRVSDLVDLPKATSKRRYLHASKDSFFSREHMAFDTRKRHGRRRARFTLVNSIWLFRNHI